MMTTMRTRPAARANWDDYGAELDAVVRENQSGRNLGVYVPPSAITWNGSTDDGPAWQAWLATVPEGACILLPGTEVTSMTSMPLLIPQGCTLTSLAVNGRNGPIIKATASFQGSAIVAARNWYNSVAGTPDPVFVSNICIDGSKAAAGNAGSDMTRPGLVLWGEKSAALGVYVLNTSGHGIVAQNLSRDGSVNLPSQNGLRFESCRVEFANGTGIRVYRSASTIGGVATANPDGFMRDNLIRNPAGRGLDVEGAAGWLIDGNHVWCGTGYMTDGIRVNGLYATRVTNNYVDKYGNTDTAGTYYGMILGIGNTGEGYVAGNQIRAKEAYAGNTQHGLRVAVGASESGILQLGGGNSINGDTATGPTGNAISWGIGSGGTLSLFGLDGVSIVGKWSSAAAPAGVTRVAG